VVGSAFFPWIADSDYVYGCFLGCRQVLEENDKSGRGGQDVEKILIGIGKFLLSLHLPICGHCESIALQYNVLDY
jgi:hypothetical protein